MSNTAVHLFRHLSSIDCDTLATVELEYGSVSEVASTLRMRPHVVQYSLKKLRDLGLLSHRRIWIDVHRLGYSFATIYLRPKFTSPTAKINFIDVLKSIACCTWIFETGGEYQIACSLTIRDISQVTEFYDALSACKDVIIHRKALNIQRDFEYFGRKYLRSRQHTERSVPLPIRTTQVEVDNVDLAILRSLSQGQPEADRELVKLTGLPRSTLSRRLTHLRQIGVLMRSYFWLDSTLLGRQLYVLRVSCGGLSNSVKAPLWRFSRSHPLIVYIVESLGSWDFEIGIDVQSALELSEATESLHAALSDSPLDIDAIPVSRFHKIRSFPA